MTTTFFIKILPINNKVLYYIYLSIFLSSFSAAAQKPIVVNKQADLNFGTFTTSSSSTSLKMDPFGNRVPAGVILINKNPGNPAEFWVYATQGKTINITFNNNPTATFTTVILTGNNGGTMQLNISQNDFNPGMSFIHTGDVNTTPTIIKMGGQLMVSPTQTPGNYSGQVRLNFNYQ